MGVEASQDEVHDLIERAVTIIRRTNSCDTPAAREILRSTAARNRLEESDVARTLVAMSVVPRRPSRPMY